MARSFFLPAMFIGIGIGLLIGNVSAWTLIGMGVGFLLDALLRSGSGNSSKVVVKRVHHPYLALALGAVFLAFGVVLLVQPSLLEVLGPRIGGIVMIGMGLLLLSSAVDSMSRGRSNK